MNEYPDYQTYTKLYGRYLTKSIEPFFNGTNLNGMRVLDLCAGAGQLSQYAIEHGAKEVVMVDEAPQMLNPAFNGNGKVIQIDADVAYYLGDFGSEIDYRVPTTNHNGIPLYKSGCPNETPFDIVVCRQAVNYWFGYVTGYDLAKVIKVGGKFVFNTFGNRPSTTPTTRQYFHGGVCYAELSYLIGDTIYHVQTAEGMPPHFTQFKWIDRGEFTMKLKPYFQLVEVIEGPSSMWYCTRL